MYPLSCLEHAWAARANDCSFIPEDDEIGNADADKVEFHVSDPDHNNELAPR